MQEFSRRGATCQGDRPAPGTRVSHAAAQPFFDCQDVAVGPACSAGRRALGMTNARHIVPRLPGATVRPLLALAVWGALVAASQGAAPGDASVAPADGCGRFDHSHGAWTTLLSRQVRSGWVDYAGLKPEGRGALAAYLATLEGVCRGHIDRWTRPQRLAFWINVYNAYAVRLVLEHHPIASIRSIGFLPFAAFRERFIPLGLLRGEADARLSLDDVEHGILRKEFGEPRIHFAIVCASKGCPALRSEAYRDQDLEAQLEHAARGFVGDPSKNRFDAAARILYLSSIFKWFRADFEAAAGSLPAFVARYTDPPTRTALEAAPVKVKFLEYDWSLNGR